MIKSAGNNSKLKISTVAINALFAVYAGICILPVLIVLAVSFSKESDILYHGYSLLPKEFTLDAYGFVFRDSSNVIRSYLVTICVTIIGSLLSLTVISMFAYPLSRNCLKYKKWFTMYIFITMLFSGGLVPWYIVCSQVLHIRNTYFALFLPTLFNAWFVIIMRTFYKTTIPDSVIESAKIDGAGEMRIFLTIVSPMALPAYATVALFCTLNYWNDWWLSMILTTDSKYRTLQYFIYKVLVDASIIQQMQNRIAANAQDMIRNLPSESARFAMCVIAMGPILFIYPFFQKYFIKGLTVGAIKG
jgi:putative aldouronate transport system permease protein